jgi:predicted KAP-like P-loop ATPase
MFDADRPIQNSDQDQLGRTVFAKSLARCILDHKNTESLAIGLSGSGGSGKTSMINLTLEELRFASGNMFDDERPIILNFSPWSYSGQEQLIYSFFRRLSSEMRRADYFKEANKIVPLLEWYVSFFTHKPIPKALRPTHSWFSRFLKSQEEMYGWESGRDLTMIKAELNELLAKQKHKIIIFIDNISRLIDHEINQILQIVKSMGDYANTIYVLAFDKEQLIGVMNRLHGVNGPEYLEKLIQLPFQIPEISKQDLTIILLDRLKKLLVLVPEESWNRDYWAEMYYSIIKYFFNNVRDITRYVNTLSFGFSWVKDLVNPVDFFAITVIEVFEPKIYYGVRDNKDLFTDLAENVYDFNAQKLAEDKVRCDEILNRVEHFPRDLILRLLTHLFPRLQKMYAPQMLSYHSEALARKNKRICALDVFDIYFRLSIPSHFISAAEMKAILDLASDEEGFSLALMRLNKDERIPEFLDALDSLAIDKITTKNAPNIISALMNNADLFPEGDNSILSCNTATRIHRIFHELLKHFTKNEERFVIFSNAIQKANNSLYIIVHELEEQYKEHVESEDAYVPLEYRDFSPEQLSALQQLAVAKILSWVDMKRLAEHPKLLPLLLAWKKWGNAEDCKQYVATITQDDRGFLAFLCAALKEPIEQTIIKLKPNPAWRSYLENINAFIPSRELIPHAKQLFEDVSFDKLREKEQVALLIFLDLVEPNTIKIQPQTG